jgi:hypothetical protein
MELFIRLLDFPLIDTSTYFNYNLWEKLDNQRKFLLSR